MLRRLIGWFLSIIVVAWAAYNLAWNPELRDKLTNWSALGWFVLVIVGLVVFVFMIVKHNPLSAPVGVLIGVVMVLGGKDILDGIDIGTILLMLGVAVVLVLLACLTILDADVLERSPRVPQRRGRRSSATSGPSAVPDSRAS